MPDKPRTPEQMLRDMERDLAAMSETELPEVPDLPDEPGQTAGEAATGDSDETPGLPEVNIEDRDLSTETIEQIATRILTAIERLPKEIVDELTG